MGSPANRTINNCHCMLLVLLLMIPNKTVKEQIIAEDR